MPDVRLCDEERAALKGLPFFVRCLYVEGIRPFMDYRTGLVGVARRVSWQSLAEELYVEPHQGETDSGTPNKMRVRRAAERLEKAGLVENRSVGKQLIFRCLLAKTDQSAQKKPDTNPTQTRHSQADTQADTSEANSGAGFARKPNTQADTNPTQVETVKPDIHPDSGTPVNTTDDDDPRAIVPQTVEQWEDFFMRRGFSHAEVVQPKLVTGFRDWIREGVTHQDALDCMRIAAAKRNGERPAYPTYYLKLMPDVLAAKANPSTRAPATGRRARRIPRSGSFDQIDYSKGVNPDGTF